MGSDDAAAAEAGSSSSSAGGAAAAASPAFLQRLLAETRVEQMELRRVVKQAGSRLPKPQAELLARLEAMLAVSGPRVCQEPRVLLGTGQAQQQQAQRKGARGAALPSLRPQVTTCALVASLWVAAELGDARASRHACAADSSPTKAVLSFPSPCSFPPCSARQVRWRVWKGGAGAQSAGPPGALASASPQPARAVGLACRLQAGSLASLACCRRPRRHVQPATADRAASPPTLPQVLSAMQMGEQGPAVAALLAAQACDRDAAPEQAFGRALVRRFPENMPTVGPAARPMPCVQDLVAPGPATSPSRLLQLVTILAGTAMEVQQQTGSDEPGEQPVRLEAPGIYWAQLELSLQHFRQGAEVAGAPRPPVCPSLRTLLRPPALRVLPHPPACARLPSRCARLRARAPPLQRTCSKRRSRRCCRSRAQTARQADGCMWLWGRQLALAVQLLPVLASGLPVTACQ